jgi:cellulose synthase/poly-beta-1,6-N-acetylglucosamine synthase-like glycosyltransferase
MNAAAWMFWSAALLLGYTYLGYPLIAAIRARIGGRPPSRSPSTPKISILVVAHNEAERIAARIDNLLALDYPREQLEIVIASDGSTDGTVERARAFRQPHVRVEAFEQNRGKPAVLNEMIPRLNGELIVLMDVRQRIAGDALRRLQENFADPEVGAVSGELVLTGHDEDGEGLEGVGFYWRYEKFIRLRESLVDSTVGATGALYALRRSLFEPIPTDTLLDDVLIPMQVVRQGFRVLFEPSARASESLSPSPEAEFRRKVRTIAGNFQLFFAHPWLLNPRNNRVWFATVSHKLFRLLCPLFLAVALVANLMLLNDHPVYWLFLVLQVAFYALATMAARYPALVRTGPLFSVPHAFCLLNAATVAGLYRFVRGRQKVTWSRVEKNEQG